MHSQKPWLHHRLEVLSQGLQGGIKGVPTTWTLFRSIAKLCMILSPFCLPWHKNNWLKWSHSTAYRYHHYLWDDEKETNYCLIPNIENSHPWCYTAEYTWSFSHHPCETVSNPQTDRIGAKLLPFLIPSIYGICGCLLRNRYTMAHAPLASQVLCNHSTFVYWIKMFF